MKTDINYCGKCGKALDFITGAHDSEAIPVNGDITVCLYCGCAHVLDGELKIRPLSTTEMLNLRTKTPEVYNDVMKLQILISNQNFSNQN